MYFVRVNMLHEMFANFFTFHLRINTRNIIVMM